MEPSPSTEGALAGAALPPLEYINSVQNFYEAVAISFLEQDILLKILSAVRIQEDGNNFCLPTWVPDWTIDPFIASLGLQPYFLNYLMPGQV